jgi:hypothetical protein
MGLRGLSVKTGSTGLAAAGVATGADADGLSVAVVAACEAVGKPEGVDIDEVPGAVAQAVSNKLRHKNAAVVQRCMPR